MRAAVALSFGIVLLAAACGDDSSGEPSCPEGTEGCDCGPAGACSGELICVGGACQPVSCTIGSAGCGCNANDTCNIDDGVQLRCESGVCVEPACEAGQEGCPCDGGLCDGALECRNERCQEPGCAVGAEGCACAADRSCDAGLVCHQNECRDDTGCPAGDLGCPCHADFSCAANLACNDDELCEPSDCPFGALGCGCPDGACEDPGASCDSESTCQRADCPAGTEGCGCGGGNRCGVNDRSEALTCESGICRSPGCMPGELGCVCREGFDCEAGDCIDGYCQPTGCVPGEEGCSCVGGSCLGTLTCRNGAVCTDNTGFLGGACYENGRCAAGHRCQDGVCTTCTVGTVGCSCDAGECFPGNVCIAELCVSEASLGAPPPTDPQCYTPCSRSHVRSDGTFVACGADGLMDGCLEGFSCNEGSCVPPGDPPVTCVSDIECPDFQTCLRGQCYAQCERDAECGAGLACHRHVCSIPCNATSAADCGAGQTCVPVDGDNGFCQPEAPALGTPSQPVAGEFELSRTSAYMSSYRTEYTIGIRNNLPHQVTFLVRKQGHHVRFADGSFDRRLDIQEDGECTPSLDCPLTWLTIDDKVGQSIELTIDANAIEEFTLGNADNGPGTGWTGTLEVIPQGGVAGPQLVTLTYTESLDGQWNGRIVYFGNFGTARLDEWAADAETRNDTQLQNRVGNAFIQRWGAFRRGAVRLEEIYAVMQSTETESWRFGSVADACPTEACYPYSGNALGVSSYSNDLRDFPIPTGIVELPFAINIWTPDPNGAPAELEGRVESSVALQYAGNPAVAIGFAGDPVACSLEAFGACITYLDAFSVDVEVGGRYLSADEDGGCDPDFTAVSVPWLLDGFDDGVVLDPESLQPARVECRDASRPFPVEGDLAALLQRANLSLAGSNPVPDGRTRHRRLELIDGVLLNNAQIVILFRETFDSFLSEDDAEGFSGYGYIVLQRSDFELDYADDDGDSTPDVFEGSPAGTVAADEPEGLLEVACSEELLDVFDDLGVAAGSSNAVGVLVNGFALDTSPEPIDPDFEAVHYLCVETGVFDGGPDNFTTHGTPMTNSDVCFAARNGLCEDGGPGAGLGPNLEIESQVAIDFLTRMGVTDIQGSTFTVGQLFTIFSGQTDNVPGEYERAELEEFLEDAGVEIGANRCNLGTDMTDCGVRTADDGDLRMECPPGSDVVFFTVDPEALSQEDIANLDCQLDGTCADQLAAWQSTPEPLIQIEPAWRCENPNAVTCRTDRGDLRDGKVFFAAFEEAVAFPPLLAAVDRAFQYHTRFRGREGTSLAFTPDVCEPDPADRNPYCYDPAVVEEVSDRFGCLLAIWQTGYASLSAEAQVLMMDQLVAGFSYAEDELGYGLRTVRMGFLRLWAELSIMLGDNAFTDAFASRFDLAGGRSSTFLGSEFEPGGIDLTGPAGFEMFSLYQSAQYYQQVLDRFYRLSPLLWEAIGRDEEEDFITTATVTTYFDKLILASTRNARAWSEIAQRYQGFNRPDLARRVIERQYTSTYLESLILTRLLLRIVDTSAAPERAQVIRAVEDAQRRYRLALTTMEQVYRGVTDEQVFMGIAPDFVPFPVVDTVGASPFEVIWFRSVQLNNLAKEREERAIASSRAFETDRAQFQAELVRIRNNYNAQLGNLCGTFVTDDGLVLPATSDYADLSEETRALVDPCGFVGTGAIHNDFGELESLQLDLARTRLAENATIQRIRNEQERVAAQCQLIEQRATFVFQRRGEEIEMEAYLNDLRRAQATADRAYGFASSMITLGQGLGTDHTIQAGLGMTAQGIAFGVYEYASQAIAENMRDAELDLANFQADTTRAVTLFECAAAAVDSNARVADELLRLHEVHLEQLQSAQRIMLKLAEIEGQFNEVRRLRIEQQEAEQLLIRVEAARNDPNVRIFRNEAVINADIAFEDALREAYRATLIFEYQTSQSYALRDQLFVIRLSATGEQNLENYLNDLQAAFVEFEEEFGIADTRVAVLSLRDDIFRIPRLDETGATVDQATRIAEMRERLTDPALLDAEGNIVVPFSTDFDVVSPATRVHRVAFIEADISGTDVGDPLGRLYVRLNGTGTIRSVDDDLLFYRFPQRTAVINPFFNGTRVYDPAVYRNTRLQFRPVLNTDLQLVINQRTETVNQDIDLNSLNDIRLYVYYTDFTPF